MVSAPLQSIAAPAGVTARVDEIYKQAVAAGERGDYSKALELFRKSYELEPNVRDLANIAVCEAKLGMVATAYARFQEVAKLLPEGDKKLRPKVDEYLAQLPARIPHLRIDLAPTAPADSRVTLDGGPVSNATLRTDMSVDPGKHVIVVTAKGRSERRYEVTSEEGKRAAIVVEPGAAVDVPKPKPSLVPPVLLGGAGALGLGAGVAFRVLFEGKRSEATELRKPILDDGKYCLSDAANFDGVRCPTLAGATAEGDTFGNLSIVSFTIGGLAAVGAVAYMFLPALWPDPKTDRHAGVSIRVAPVVADRAQAVILSGSF
jgi:hypothetical protein